MTASVHRLHKGIAALLLLALAATLPAAALAQADAGSSRAAVDPDFRLGPGDVLLISVLEDPALDTEALIRPDGRISMPLAGAVMAAGRTPEALAAAIRASLAPGFVEPPTVNVALRALAPPGDEEEDRVTIYVLGQVKNAGAFDVDGPVGLLQALSLAGGLDVFAAERRVQLRRQAPDGREEVIVVDYAAIEKGAAAPNLLLGDGDTVVVPERGLFE